MPGVAPLFPDSLICIRLCWSPCANQIKMGQIASYIVSHITVFAFDSIASDSEDVSTYLRLNYMVQISNIRTIQQSLPGETF